MRAGLSEVRALLAMPHADTPGTQSHPGQCVSRCFILRKQGLRPPPTRRRGWARRRHAWLPWGSTLGRACRLRDARAWATRRLAPALDRSGLAGVRGSSPWRRSSCSRLVSGIAGVPGGIRVAQRRVERVGGRWSPPPPPGLPGPRTSWSIPRVGLPRGTREGPRASQAVRPDCRALQDSQERPGLHPGRLPQLGPTPGWTRDRAPVTIA